MSGQTTGQAPADGGNQSGANQNMQSGQANQNSVRLLRRRASRLRNNRADKHALCEPRSLGGLFFARIE
jgi:hypothetical protein